MSTPLTGTLIRPRTLSALLDGPAGPARPVVVEVTASSLGRRTRADHDAGHVPGAVVLDLDADLAAPPGPGGRHPLPDARLLQSALRRIGVRRDSWVVVLDHGDGSIAARAWWLLRWAGLAADRAAVLDGGWAAWVRDGLPVTAGATTAEPGDVEVRPGAMPVLDADGAVAVVAAGGALVDARAPARFRGETEPLDPVAGHIRGARNVPATELVGADGHWLPPEVIAERLGGLGVRAGAPVGAYCGSGVTAAALVLAAEYAGLRGAAEPVPLFVGSWSSWCADPDRPVAVGPAGADHLRSRP